MCPEVAGEHHGANARGPRLAQGMRKAVNRATTRIEVVDHEHVQTVHGGVVDVPLVVDILAQSVRALALPAMATPSRRHGPELA
jgi:hypothetical protein